MKVWAGLCVAALALGPFVFLRSRGARWSPFGLGILSWIGGVAVKSLAMSALDRTGLGTCAPAVQALVGGLVSAVTELGAAWLLLRRARLSLADVLAFGAGIGVFELLFTLGIGVLEQLDETATPAVTLSFVDGFFLLERFLSLIGHVASRLLVYAGAKRTRPLAGAAVLLFAAVDGAATYGITADWNWEDPVLLARFYAFVAGIGALEVLAAWRAAREVPWGPEPAPAKPAS
jgi:hypothetical protein